MHYTHHTYATPQSERLAGEIISTATALARVRARKTGANGEDATLSEALRDQRIDLLTHHLAANAAMAPTDRSRALATIKAMAAGHCRT